MSCNLRFFRVRQRVRQRLNILSDVCLFRHVRWASTNGSSCRSFGFFVQFILAVFSFSALLIKRCEALERTSDTANDIAWCHSHMKRIHQVSREATARHRGVQI